MKGKPQQPAPEGGLAKLIGQYKRQARSFPATCRAAVVGLSAPTLATTRVTSSPTVGNDVSHLMSRRIATA